MGLLFIFSALKIHISLLTPTSFYHFSYVELTFLKNNAGMLRLKMYDILRQRSNISYSATATAIRYSEYNTLSSYVMLHFIYRFSLFKGGAKASDMRMPGPPDRGGRDRPPRD